MKGAPQYSGANGTARLLDPIYSTSDRNVHDQNSQREPDSKTLRCDLGKIEYHVAQEMY